MPFMVCDCGIQFPTLTDLDWLYLLDYDEVCSQSTSLW